MEKSFSTEAPPPLVSFSSFLFLQRRKELEIANRSNIFYWNLSISESNYNTVYSFFILLFLMIKWSKSECHMPKYLFVWNRTRN